MRKLIIGVCLLMLISSCGGLALAADDGGLGPPPGREDRVRLQLPGVAHDHGQRGADVMGDAVDPVGTGKVPGNSNFIRASTVLAVEL